jgi:FkbM family methyltransferase
VGEIREIVEEYKARKHQIELPMEQVYADLHANRGRICLYGAGSAGIAFLYYLRRIGIEPSYFVDKNSIRWGGLCEGVEVIGPQEILGRVGKEALVIVTINTDGKRYCKSFDEELRKGGHSGVYQMLHSVGVERIIDYTFFRRCYEWFQADPYNLPSCSDVYLMVEKVDEMERVYEHLSDAQSKEVFQKIVRFRMLEDSVRIPTMSQELQYFEPEFYPKREDAVFLDCGAYDGISARMFLQQNGSTFEGYYGLEPDENNYQKLCLYREGLPTNLQSKMQIYQKAVYHHKEGERLYALHGPGSFLADIGKDWVETTTIDDVLDGGKVTYIKMNIEGSEVQALEGARHTIAREQPRLAIAGYHKTRDLWEVPLKILEIHPNYRFSLRSYMNHLSFVYYGVERDNLR